MLYISRKIKLELFFHISDCWKKNLNFLIRKYGCLKDELKYIHIFIEKTIGLPNLFCRSKCKMLAELLQKWAFRRGMSNSSDFGSTLYVCFDTGNALLSLVSFLNFYWHFCANNTSEPYVHKAQFWIQNGLTQLLASRANWVFLLTVTKRQKYHKNNICIYFLHIWWSQNGRNCIRLQLYIYYNSLYKI